jgi:methionine sulfoxide reductase heme-binding subunit
MNLHLEAPMISTKANLLATAIGPHLFWITSRAAGIAALLLSSMSICIGLLMGGGTLKASPTRRADLRVTHEALSLATLAALVIHGMTLIGDSYLHPSLSDVAIPFLSGYKTFWTSIGIVAFWMLTILGLSYYTRTRIGVQRWRALHRFTALAWILGLAHSLGEGIDAGQTWFLAMSAIAAVPAIALLIFRLAHSHARPSASSQAVPAKRQHSSRKLATHAIPQPDRSDHGLA